MGLLGCPASLQCLIETIINGISNIIFYINDLLVQLATHEESLAVLDHVLKCFVHHNIKKCIFGIKEVSYLGFRLTREGIKPSTKKLIAFKMSPPPSGVHKVRKFCQFFREHVRNFVQLTDPLTSLTKKTAPERRPAASRHPNSLSRTINILVLRNNCQLSPPKSSLCPNYGCQPRGQQETRGPH